MKTPIKKACIFILLFLLSACDLVKVKEDRVVDYDVKIGEARSILKIGKKEIGLEEAKGMAIVGSKIYFVDGGSASIKVLDEKGKFIKELYSKEAPLIAPVDIDIEDNIIYIADNGDKKIKIYDLDLSFIKEVNIPEFKDKSNKVESILALKGKIYLTSDASYGEDMRIFSIDSKNQLKRYGQEFNGCISKERDRVYALERMEYMLDKDTNESYLMSGQNRLFILKEDEGLVKMKDLNPQYAPATFAKSKEGFYVFSMALHRLDAFDNEGNYKKTLSEDFEWNDREIYPSYMAYSEEGFIVLNPKNEESIQIIYP